MKVLFAILVVLSTSHAMAESLSPLAREVGITQTQNIQAGRHKQAERQTVGNGKSFYMSIREISDPAPRADKKAFYSSTPCYSGGVVYPLSGGRFVCEDA